MGVQIEADLKVNPDGTVQLKESDSFSLNLAPITVQLPGGERVPFLFTIKVRGNTPQLTQQACDVSWQCVGTSEAHGIHRSCSILKSTSRKDAYWQKEGCTHGRFKSWNLMWATVSVVTW